jgi:ferredoxin
MRRPVALCIDRIACDGRGTCAEILPELITLDDWGYPIIAEGTVPQDLEGIAQATVEICPKMALRLESVKER